MLISYKAIIILETNLASIQNYDKYLDRFIWPIYDIEKKTFVWSLLDHSEEILHKLAHKYLTTSLFLQVG